MAESVKAAARSSLRIGCGAGFWGDSAAGAAQLVRSGGIDVLMLDYLAEITMSILARIHRKRPELGYATDFVDGVIGALAGEIAERKIKVVANAGGVNPLGCRDALVARLAKLGVKLEVAVVVGDDVTPHLEHLREMGRRDLESGGDLPTKVVSANAYLGAFPIAAALRAGADIVVTGRCVDSALALGPLIAAFDWKPSDHDRLAAGSLAGHVLECGVQATGGLFTDWREVADGWDDMGFPIAECFPDGSFELSKPAGTGGLVSPATVAEQIVYEVHDPQAYVLPDVVCDFTHVALESVGENRVRVSGARGAAPTPDYKASLTYMSGFRVTSTIMILGRDAAAKARRVGEAILARTRRLAAERGLGDFRATSIEVLGSEENFGAAARTGEAREVVLKIAAMHESEEALEILAREIAPSATAMAQGITGFAGGRPTVQPVVRLASCLVPKAMVSVETVFGDDRTKVAIEAETQELHAPPRRLSVDAPPKGESLASVPLLRLAHGRSGDKGDAANVAILARREEFRPWIAAALTPESVHETFAHFVRGAVERYDWPGLRGLNFVLRQALGGGGTSSLRYDPQGKGLAQILLEVPVPVPARWLEPGGLLDERS